KTLFSNELRFLCEISINNNFGYVPWDLIYKDMNFIPRIMFEDIVVSPKTWRIFKFELSNIAIESIIKQRNIPNKIYIVDGDNKLYINRKNSLDVELFMSEVKRNIEKNGYAIIQEYFNNKDMIYKDSEGKISEIVVPVINSKFDVKKVNKEKQQRISKHVREKLPFNDWLYLKVYMSTRRQEEFIRVYIPLIQKKVEKLDGKLFFLRYMDPVPQIRIRISDNNLYKIYEI
ncbi:Nisin biosynthesis protein NisB, partial [Lactobacillus salivarius]|nr:Nisin biosynthesis protein NisB [Ligilactobacillus salivarius]